MIEAYNVLGQAVFNTLVRSPGNVVISPLSMGMSIAAAFAAARGETAREMARALGLATAALGALLKANGELVHHYRNAGVSEALCLRLANALVLTQHGVAVAESYKDLLAFFFAAEVFKGDIRQVNQWVARKTEGKIEKALGGLPADGIAVLLNAVYFKAPWAEPFDPASTYAGRFFLPSEEMKVQMMSRHGDYAVVSGPGFRAARLPYKNPALGMIVVLPDESGGCPLDVFEPLAPAGLTRLRAELHREPPSDCIVEMPRFRASFSESLKPALQEAGIVRAFDWTRADFSGMTDRAAADVPAAVGDVRHCALIEVGEEGTEAAGATAMTFFIGGTPSKFTVDRPFLFFIVDETTGTVLFQGRIVYPR
jgi:serpin B